MYYDFKRLASDRSYTDNPVIFYMRCRYPSDGKDLLQRGYVTTGSDDGGEYRTFLFDPQDGRVYHLSHSFTIQGVLPRINRENLTAFSHTNLRRT